VEKLNPPFRVYHSLTNDIKLSFQRESLITSLGECKQTVYKLSNKAKNPENLFRNQSINVYPQLVNVSWLTLPCARKSGYILW